MKLFRHKGRNQKVQETVVETDSESSSNDSSERSSSSSSGPSSCSKSRGVSSKDHKDHKQGLPNNLSAEQHAQLATQNGVTRCSECGIKTHKVGVYDGRRAHYYITNAFVYEGICINCNPAHVPSRIFRQYLRMHGNSHPEGVTQCCQCPLCKPK